jgi:hypothetical protein
MQASHRGHPRGSPLPVNRGRGSRPGGGAPIDARVSRSRAPFFFSVGAMLCWSGAAMGQQPVVPAEHRWTDIGTSGGTSVDWDTLERQDVHQGETLFLIWARTGESRGTVLVRVAIHCRPRHAAVVEVRRTHDSGSAATTRAVPLADLVWQDPGPRSYLADVESAVCARTRDERVRPC